MGALLAEEEARLRRLELKRGRKRAEVVESSVVGEPKAIANGTNGNHVTSENAGTEVSRGILDAAATERNVEAVELLRRVSGILNRGGPCDEKVAEARMVLGEARGFLGSGG